MGSARNSEKLAPRCLDYDEDFFGECVHGGAGSASVLPLAHRARNQLINKKSFLIETNKQIKCVPGEAGSASVLPLPEILKSQNPGIFSK